MYKIRQVANKFNLSRSTLLYYESIGLLNASERTSANYRLYSGNDIKRLELICMYKDMGIDLKSIAKLLNDKTEETKIMEAALIKMEESITEIRIKQNKIMSIIQNEINKPSGKAVMFSNVLRNMGLSEDDLDTFHREFEKSDKKGHYSFLKYLGLNDSDISKVLLKIND